MLFISVSGRWKTSARQQVLLLLVVVLEAVIFAAVLLNSRVQLTLAPLLAGLVAIQLGAVWRISEYQKLNQRWGTFRESMDGTSYGSGAIISAVGFMLLGSGILVILALAETPMQGSRWPGTLLFAGLGLILLAMGGQVIWKRARARKHRA